MAVWKKIIVSGSNAHLNQVTASFFSGDGSGINNVISSSYALTASYALNGGGAPSVTASYALTASYLDNVAKYFATFEKPIADVTWSFQHNLSNRFPVITVWDSNYEVVIPEKIYSPSVNQTVIYFPTSQSGYAAAAIGSILPTGSNGIFSGSFFGDGSGLTGIISSVPNGTVSGSEQLTSSYDARYHRLGTGLISSSNQISTDISGSTTALSASISSRVFSLEQTTGSLNSITGSILNRLTSLQSVTSSYATTGSNTFIGNQIISGSLNVTGSINVIGQVSGTFIGNGSGLTGIIATANPAGPDKSLQFNDADATSGSLNFTFDKTNNSLYLTGSLIATSITSSLQGSASYALTASYAIRGGSQVVGINSQVGTAYTLSLADAGQYLRMNNANPITLTIPTNAAVPFETGSVVSAIQVGAGIITVSGSGVTMNAFDGRKTAGQYAVIQMIKVDTNIWDIIGGVA